MKSTALLQFCILALMVMPASLQEKPPQKKASQPPLLFAIVQDGKLGYIDHTGAVVIAPRFASAMFDVRFSEGLATVGLAGRLDYIDHSGRVVIRTTFDYAGPFSEGLAPVGVARQDGIRYGYIDKTGKVVIEPQFDETYGFSEGLGRVVVGGKTGFIDKKGKMVIEPQFEGAY